MCLRAAFVPHRPNKYCHVTASNGIVLSSPYTPLAIMTASPIASDGVFETSAIRMSARYVRCAPSAVDDISRDHHAEQSSVLGTCFWPSSSSAKTLSSFHPLLARPCRSALPREQFSPMTRSSYAGASYSCRSRENQKLQWPAPPASVCSQTSRT